MRVRWRPAPGAATRPRGPGSRPESSSSAASRASRSCCAGWSALRRVRGPPRRPRRPPTPAQAIAARCPCVRRSLPGPGRGAGAGENGGQGTLAGRRGVLLPQRVDQPVARDRTAAVQDQESEQHPSLAPADQLLARFPAELDSETPAEADARPSALHVRKLANALAISRPGFGGPARLRRCDQSHSCRRLGTGQLTCRGLGRAEASARSDRNAVIDQEPEDSTCRRIGDSAPSRRSSSRPRPRASSGTSRQRRGPHLFARPAAAVRRPGPGTRRDVVSPAQRRRPVLQDRLLLPPSEGDPVVPACRRPIRRGSTWARSSDPSCWSRSWTPVDRLSCGRRHRRVEHVD